MAETSNDPNLIKGKVSFTQGLIGGLLGKTYVTGSGSTSVFGIAATATHALTGWFTAKVWRSIREEKGKTNPPLLLKRFGDEIKKVNPFAKKGE